MLYEIQGVRQEEPQLIQRWFTTDLHDFELYLWEDRQQPNDIKKFHIMYEKFPDGRVLEWHYPDIYRQASFTPEMTGGLYKPSVILVPDHQLDLLGALQAFIGRMEGLPDSIRKFILARLIRPIAEDLALL